jgi:CRISP-associated protein Cas1
MIRPPWKFDGRNRRPPKDPVNAVLSFAYVVVGSEIQSLLDGIGFDPYLGFYHSIHYGRPSLALDLLEEFRHSFVDRLILKLFNRHTFTESDFYNPPAGGVYMNTEGKKKFFVQYEKMLGDYVSASSVNIQKTGIRSVFQKQIHLLAKAIQQDIPYKPWSG